MNTTRVLLDDVAILQNMLFVSSYSLMIREPRVEMSPMIPERTGTTQRPYGAVTYRIEDNRELNSDQPQGSAYAL